MHASLKHAAQRHEGPRVDATVEAGTAGMSDREVRHSLAVIVDQLPIFGAGRGPKARERGCALHSNEPGEQMGNGRVEPRGESRPRKHRIQT